MKKNKQEKEKRRETLRTEGPIGHRRRSANEFRILLNHQVRQWSSKEVQVNNSSNHLVRDLITTVYNIHAITIKQENSMTLNGR